MLFYQAQPKPPRQRQAFPAVKNEVLHLFRQPFSVRVPLPHRGKGVKEKGARGRNQKREGRCESFGRALPSLLWCLPRTILLSFPITAAEQSKKSLFVCISSNTDTLLIFLQDNIPGEALQIVARGHHKRRGRSLTAVQGRLRSSPLPLKVPPSDPPPLSPSPLSNRTESNANTRIPCYSTKRSQSLRGRGRLSLQ